MIASSAIAGALVDFRDRLIRADMISVARRTDAQRAHAVAVPPGKLVNMRALLLMTLIVACRPDDAPRAKSLPMKSQAKIEPPIEPRIAAIGDISHLPPPLRRAFDPADDFEPTPEPGPNDWLAQHPEKPQSYASWLDRDTNVIGPQHNVIYLLPIGEFPRTAPSLDALSKVVAAFFTLDVRVLPAVPVADVTATTRINASTKKRQRAGERACLRHPPRKASIP